VSCFLIPTLPPVAAACHEDDVQQS